MSEERRCQLKALLNEAWGKVPGTAPKLTLVHTVPQSPRSTDGGGVVPPTAPETHTTQS